MASAWDRGREALERIPLTWPAWITATRVATAIVAFGAATSTALLTAWIPAGVLERTIMLGAGIGFSTYLAYWVCRAPSPAKAFNRTMGAGILHALFCGGLLAPLFIIAAQRGVPHESPFALFFGFMVGSLVLAIPFGGAIGLAYTVVPATAARARERPSHSAVDRVLLLGGAWLLFVALAHLTVLWKTLGLPFAKVTAMEETLLTMLCVAPALIGAVALAVPVARAIRRARFLASARAGGNGTFRVATRHGRSTPEHVLPLVHGIHPDACRSVLVRVAEPSREVLYREAAEPEPEERVVALLP